ncbi:MAG: site-2 protease family protein [Actinomycetia bacterium]|nr:site-2 protease family protein [Actinomycetes bacterium]
MNRGIRLGRVGGVEIIADLSVFVIAAAMVWVLYVDIGVVYPQTDPAFATTIAVVAGALFILSVLLHEGSHAVLAKRRGLEVRRIQLLAFGGYTKIEGNEERPTDEFVVSIAGPIASLVVAGIFSLAAVTATGIPEVQSSLRFLAFVNLFIAVFNILPGFPLDGGRALRAAVWHFTGDRVKATNIAVASGRIFGWAVIGVATVVAFTGFDPWAMLWIILGWYLLRSAGVAGKRERMLAQVDGLVAGDVMRRTPDPVPGEMLVGTVVDLFQIGARLRSLPVEVDGRIRGVLGESELERLSPARRVSIRASAAMAKIGPGDVVDIRMPLEAMATRPAGKTGRFVVVENGHAVGIIEGADLQSVVDQ